MASEVASPGGAELPGNDSFPGSAGPDGHTNCGAGHGPTLAEMPQPQTHIVDNSVSKAVDEVLYSDIGVSTLLNRLKQSIASARDFAAFLKKRSELEEHHAQGLKKLCRSTHDTLRRPDARHGSYAARFEDVTRVHERMADNGMQFALSLHQMHEDLSELSANMERGRKQWKQQGLAAEKKTQDAEALMEKAKAKYDGLADDYDRVRTGDKSAGRVFGIKGPKSAAQHEEDLLRKLQTADADYAAKVQSAQSLRQELVSTLRPQAIHAMQELIAECDSGLTLQLQKFATFNEKLLLGNGILVAPIKDAPAPSADADTAQPVSPSAATAPPSQQKSLREMVAEIDNERDFRAFVTEHLSKVPPRHADIKYEKHPTLAGPRAPPTAPSQSQPQLPAQQQHQQSVSTPQQTTGTTGSRQGRQSISGPPTLPPPSFGGGDSPQAPTAPQLPPFAQQQGGGFPQSPQQGPGGYPYPGGPNSYGPPPGGAQQRRRSESFGRPGGGAYGGASPPPGSGFGHAGYPPMSGGGAPQGDGRFGSQTQFQPQGPPGPPGPPQQQQLPQQSTSPTGGPGGPGALPHGNGLTMGGYEGPPAGAADLPPVRPVFGVSLDELFARDQTPVPMVVYQCIQAVDLFGLDVEGIYRVPGTASSIQMMKAMFDNGNIFLVLPPPYLIDASKVDFRNPSSFLHDVNSVAGLLKSFFRDLPDPLFTAQHYAAFIDAARIDDDAVRRDALHARINDLPDPNYATLRALVLHLNRVQEHQDRNRMSAANLAICWAPTLLGPHRGPLQDAGLQARVLDTILVNTYQIFDED
ncbi:hypothetical protein BDY21DRAFT_377678 [Lineolata rhizophorae]|uniref:Rho GTPase activator n=1 Tax=Lineolata rhizophorae TaxID=578093 RepID=A0A6A6P9L9_9PEZI|nr:hypothetical protein BDY21DRAFT_377678 [Lineolata rhizophorae]